MSELRRKSSECDRRRVAAVPDGSIPAELPIGLNTLGSKPSGAQQTGAGNRDIPVHFASATFTASAIPYYHGVWPRA